MRRSLYSLSGCAPTIRLCATCRNSLSPARISCAALSASTASPTQRSFRSLAQQRSAPTPRSWAPSLTPKTLARFSSSDSSSSSGSSSSPSSPDDKIPTYYALFPETLPSGPPPRGKFHIDTRALRREFLRLQAASHPDFHHHAASTSPPDSSSPDSHKSAARLRAEATSALINAAYKTLSSPLLRAQYLLRELHGIDLESDERPSHPNSPHASFSGVSEAGEGSIDPEEAQELLFTVLEAREAIEEVRTEEDLKELKEANEARIAESERKVGEALEKGDVKAAVGEVVRLRYWMGIREGIDNWEEGKGVVLNH
ncbi:hypothetical protein VTJ04DRAFT_6031 [Mycothermus thermophilus]|uniref:uncharacterized protein n=1 Tax=Humicola insolens TaxID=85995 RepID=UPI003743BD67